MFHYDMLCTVFLPIKSIPFEILMCSFLQVVNSTPHFHLMSHFLQYDNNFVLKTINYCINTKSMVKVTTLEILSIKDVIHLMSKAVVQY